jgi:acetyl esterase/lipase
MDRASIMSWPDLTRRPRPTPTREVRLGDQPWDVVDLWLPDGRGPHPVVVMVHGGCWQKAIADRTLLNYAAEDLRARGLAVWNIEYRGVDEPGGGYPGTFADVSRAADTLLDKAQAFNLEMDRVLAFGHSAGGHLALWLAARQRLPAGHVLHTASPLRFHAVVNSGGLADLAASRSATDPSCLDAVFDNLIGSDRLDALSDTSPAEMLPIGVLQISVNGGRDRIAPPALGEAYTARARLAGDPAEFHLVPDDGHVELIAPGSQAFELQARRLLALAGIERLAKE